MTSYLSMDIMHNYNPNKVLILRSRWPLTALISLTKLKFTAQTICCLISVEEARVMLSKLLGLFLRHALNLVVLLPSYLPPVLATEPCPEG